MIKVSFDSFYCLTHHLVTNTVFHFAGAPVDLPGSFQLEGHMYIYLEREDVDDDTVNMIGGGRGRSRSPRPPGNNRTPPGPGMARTERR